MQTSAQLTVLAVSIFAAITGTAPFATQAPASREPTFNRDIAPILFNNCVGCHRPGGVAPMPLLTYADAQAWGPEIQAMVRERAMPPWFADPRYGEFRNARGLTAQQIDTVSRWVDAGAPQGDGRPPSPPRLPTTGWRLDRAPDQILELPFGEYPLPSQGEVRTFTVWLKLPLREDRWVQAIEIKPSIQNALHHSSLSIAPGLPPGTRIGRGPVFPGGPVLDGVPMYPDGRAFSTASAEAFGKPIMFYVPGGGLMQLQDGLAKRFRRDDWLAWGLHLISPGRTENLRVQIGIWYARSDPHHEVHTWTINQALFVEGKELPAGANRRIPDIPANASNWAMTGTLKVDDDITIHALWPHMHYRGKDMTFALTEPTGRQQTLLSVPRYNPHWQLTYELARPLRVRRGSTLTASGHFDNSAANLHNPDPSVAVRFGEQGTEEMFIPFIEVTVDREDLRLQRPQEFIR